MNDVKRVIADYIKEKDNIEYFYGEENNNKDILATTILAKACSMYKEDVEEELLIENEVTCYNCRYRRWANIGFSCYKGFPLSE